MRTFDNLSGFSHTWWYFYQMPKLFSRLPMLPGSNDYMDAYPVERNRVRKLVLCKSVELVSFIRLPGSLYYILGPHELLPADT